MHRFKLFMLAATIGFGLAMSAPASAQGPGCNCSYPDPTVTPILVAENQQEMCVTVCMTPAEWAACPTKSWWASSKDQRSRTPRFFERCGTVCRPHGFPRMSYFTTSSTRRHVVFRFGEGS